MSPSRHSTSQKDRDPLATPIRVKRYRATLVGLSKEEVLEKNIQAMAAAHTELVTKVNLLFERFEIQRTGNEAKDYKELAFALALEYVPGCKLVPASLPGRGRPKRDPLFLMRLLIDTEIVKIRKRLVQQSESDARAIHVLTSNSSFSSRWGKFSGKERTLLNYLIAARDPSQNPLFVFWKLPDKTGQIRQDLMKIFRLTKKAI